jgi:tagatose 6-phosphate kinase
MILTVTRVLHALAARASAAVPCPLAGDLDLDSYARPRPAITVEDLDAHADR